MTGLKELRTALVGKTIKSVKNLGDWGTEDLCFEVLRIETMEGDVIHLSMYSPQDYVCAKFEVVTLDDKDKVVIDGQTKTIDEQSWLK